MEFTTEEKKKLNEFLDKYEYLLEQEDYVTFLKKYRDQNKQDTLYYTLVDLIKKIFDLNIESFIKDDPEFYWHNYVEDSSHIDHINIPAGMTKISKYAFSACSSLSSVTIPDSVTTIGEDAFRYCFNLETVIFGENSQLTTIGPYAFYSCDSLTSIIIPDSVTTIGDYAFYDCSSLTIYCEATSKPSGWHYNWNSSNCPVVWGYKKK